jgi:hypothetical protein
MDKQSFFGWHATSDGRRSRITQWQRGDGSIKSLSGHFAVISFALTRFSGNAQLVPNFLAPIPDGSTAVRNTFNF